jgi:hypothetical protein
MQVQKKRIKENKMESNYVVNVKTKANTIVTVRGNSAEEFSQNIGELIQHGVNDHIAALEELFLGTGNAAVATVIAAVNGNVVSDAPHFLPVPPPASAAPVAPVGGGTAERSCIHGQMTKREGNGQWGPYKAFYCPTPKGTPDQCKPSYVKPNDPEWATF